MKEKVRLSKKWVAFSLPLLILLLLSASYVLSQSNGQITATVFVKPAAKVTCNPGTLLVGSNVQWISCVINIDNANVNDIPSSSVTLGLLPANSTCNIPVNTNTFNVLDNHNVFVQFNRNAADTNCFLNNPLHPLPTNFALYISGTVGGFPFSATTQLNYVQTCQDNHVHTLEANTTTGSGTIVALNAPGFNLSEFKSQSFNLDGFFDCRNNKIVGDMEFFATGTINHPINITWLPFLSKLFVVKTPVQISAVFSTLDNCFADSTTHMECVGNGVVFVDKLSPFQRTRIPVSNIFVEVNGKNATVEAGQVFNDVLNVQNLFISKVTIRPSIPKI